MSYWKAMEAHRNQTGSEFIYPMRALHSHDTWRAPLIWAFKALRALNKSFGVFLAKTVENYTSRLKPLMSLLICCYLQPLEIHVTATQKIYPTVWSEQGLLP